MRGGEADGHRRKTQQPAMATAPFCCSSEWFPRGVAADECFLGGCAKAWLWMERTRLYEMRRRGRLNEPLGENLRNRA